MVKGRFQLYKKIARGGMAEIFIGKQFGEDGFQRICCVKRILPYYAQDIEFIRMFRDEAHICKRLQHGNIVRVEGFEEVEGSYALIMEFINGCDLRAALAACEVSGQRIPVPYALHIIAEAARGLHYAHEKVDEVTNRKLEIIHRDISPQNILVSFEGDVKVTDFGIADAEDKSSDTKPGIVKGKYSYMSPEQVLAQTVDVRTDTFALCIVLWEMLSMRRLFQGENEVETITLVKNCKVPVDLQQVNPDVDRELKDLIEKGLKADASQRFQTAAELEITLRKYINRRYPDFTVADLSSFLKKLLSDKVEENTNVIRELLQDAPKLGEVDPGIHASSSLPPKMSFNQHQDPSSFRVKGQIVAKQKPLSESFASPQARKSALNEPVKEMRAKPRPAATFGNPRTHASRQSRSRSNESSTGSALRIVTALFLLAALGVLAFINQGKLLKEEPAQIVIDTVPNVVQISVDGKFPWGKFVTTPIKRTLSNGKHFITINRDGFQEESFVVDAQSNAVIKKTKVVLTRIDKMAPTRVVLDSSFNDKTRVVLDDGLVDEFIEKGQSLNLKNITFGQSHKLLVYPVAPYSSPTFVCKFIPRAQSWQAPYIVELNPADKSCSFPLR